MEDHIDAQDRDIPSPTHSDKSLPTITRNDSPDAIVPMPGSTADDEEQTAVPPTVILVSSPPHTAGSSSSAPSFSSSHSSGTTAAASDAVVFEVRHRDCPCCGDVPRVDVAPPRAITHYTGAVRAVSARANEAMRHYAGEGPGVRDVRLSVTVRRAVPNGPPNGRGGRALLRARGEEKDHYHMRVELSTSPRQAQHAPGAEMMALGTETEGNAEAGQAGE